MKASEVRLGAVYIVRVSGVFARVRLNQVSPYGGWIGVNLKTGREVRFRTAGRLRREVPGSDKTADSADTSVRS